MGEKARLGQDLAEPAQLARVLVHLAAHLALPALELLLESADLAVLLKQLTETGRAHHLQLSLTLEKALGLDLEALHHPP